MVTCLSPNGCDLTESTGPISHLKVATVRGIVTLERATPGGAWIESGRVLENIQIGSLVEEPRSGRMFAGAHGNNGLWISGDGGRSWTEKSNGLPSQHIYTIATQYRGNRTVLFVGVEPAMLLRSDDLGETFYDLAALRQVPDTDKWCFPPPPHIAHVKHVASHPSAPETLYVCIEQGAVLKTTDDGKSWTELHGYEQPDMDIKFRHDTHRVIVRKSNPQDVYLAAGEGLYASSNGGADWRQLQSRFDRIGYPDAMLLDPRDDQTLYLGGAGNAPEEWRESRNSAAGVIRSKDSGLTWQELNNGLPSPLRGNIEAMALHHAGPYLAVLVGTATGEVYLSEDAGDSWNCIAADLPPISKAGHYRWFLSDAERSQVVETMKKWKDPYEVQA